MIDSKSFFSLCFLLAFAVPGQADDWNEASKTPTSTDWTGGYVSVFTGHTFGSDVNVDPWHRQFFGSKDLDVAMLGVGGGYRWHLDNDVVLGASLSIPVWSGGGEIGDINGNTGGFYADPRFAYTASGEVGYAVDRFLPFVHAGVGHAWVEGGSKPGGFTPNGTRQTNVHTVFSVGGGLAYQLNEMVNLRAQYSYIHASKENYNDSANIGARAPNDFGWSGNAVFFAVEFKFPVN